MSVKVATNRFIHSSFERYAGFYQQLLRSVSGFHELGRKLIGAAETAIALRQLDSLEELGSILSNLPLKEYQVIGHYYQAWCLYRRGKNSRALFEKVIEQSDAYRARGFISLAALEARSGDYASELSYYAEAIKHARNPTTLVTALRASAVVKAKEGFHKQALKDLEKLMPLVRFAKPHLYYDFLNSLAVELCEAGRMEEARNISNIVLASPYVFAYPEWRETGDEIERKGYRSSRSFVPITQGATQYNIVRLPEREIIPISQDEPGRVLYYDWKNKMVKEPNNDSDEAVDAMDDKELLVKLIQLTAKEDINVGKLRRIVKYAIEVMNKPDQK